jgi:hypothetical protein
VLRAWVAIEVLSLESGRKTLCLESTTEALVGTCWEGPFGLDWSGLTVAEVVGSPTFSRIEERVGASSCGGALTCWFSAGTLVWLLLD